MVKSRAIEWGTKSGANFGRLPRSDIRIERTRNDDNHYGFLLSDDQSTYLYVHGIFYPTMKEMERAALEWIGRHKKLTI